MRPSGIDAIRRIIETVARTSPSAAERASRALSQLLKGVIDSPWPHAAWCFSHLTSTGFPVEIAWASSDSAIRYTCEIAGPEADPAERLEEACCLLERLTTQSVPEDLQRSLHSVQARGKLKYGAWISGRHAGETDDFKLYAEVPDCVAWSVDAPLPDMLRGGPLLPSRCARPRMIGYTLSSGQMEFYFRVDELESWELAVLLRRCGLASHQANFMAFLETVYDCRIRERLPGSNYGVAIAPSPDGDGSSFSLFTFADCVFGHDEEIRRRILLLGRNQRWPVDLYKALTDPDLHGGAVARHGMVAFVLSHAMPPGLHIGFAPSQENGSAEW